MRAASRQLGIPQPVISCSIQEMERELGVQLFERTSSGSVMTQVARARQVRLERVAGLDLAWISRDTRLAHALLWLAARQRPRQRSGMLVRLLAGRPAGQLDDLNGAVVRAAEELSLAAPLNARLVALVRSIERGEEQLGVHQLARLLL